jgi:hypothetical protein
MIYGCFRAWRGVRTHSSTDWEKVALDWYRACSPLEQSNSIPFHSVRHVIVIPNYAEDPSILEETLSLLASHPLASVAYHPVLAMEGREAGCREKAQRLTILFKHRFHDIGYTIHPPDIPGEVSGKSSNLAWACKQLWVEMDLRDKIKARTVVTVIDSDSECLLEPILITCSRTRGRLLQRHQLQIWVAPERREVSLQYVSLS